MERVKRAERMEKIRKGLDDWGDAAIWNTLRFPDLATFFISYKKLFDSSRVEIFDTNYKMKYV
jgi:hypothetical protein